MSFLYSESSKMSTSASISANHKFTLLIIETEISIKTDAITKLTRADNYQTWETQLEYLLIIINAEEIVLENLQPASDATAEELRLHQKIFKNAFVILIQTLAPEILTACLHHLSPPEF
jgi:inactivated superfamily I helicase